MSDLERSPNYLKIAIRIAERIVNGDLTVGQRVSGRSLLAPEYGVSPETIRRALKLLSVITSYSIHYTKLYDACAPQTHPETTEPAAATETQEAAAEPEATEAPAPTQGVTDTEVLIANSIAVSGAYAPVGVPRNNFV